MRHTLITLLLCGASLVSAAEFQNFQAARAVVGQSSFSSSAGGLTPEALSLHNDDLHVADAAGRLLTFDISQIGGAKSPGCPVCVASPAASVQQNFFQGISKVAVRDGNVVIADSQTHRVLVWKDKPALGPPDLTLIGLQNPTSVAIDDHRLFVGDSSSHHVFIWNTLPTAESQAPDVTLGVDASDGPGPDTIQSPSALASDGTNLYVADSASHRVLVFTASDHAMPQVLNAATLGGGPFAPGTLVTIRQGPDPATVLLNGNILPISESDSDQIQVQIPLELNAATAGSLWIKTQTDSAAAAIRFTTASPGIFAFGATEPRTGLLLHPGSVPLSPEQPAHPSEILTVWATGLGAVSSEINDDRAFDTVNPVHASVNGSPVEVLSAALPVEATGVYEVRLRLPAQLPANSTLMLIESDMKSNAVVFPATNTPE